MQKKLKKKLKIYAKLNPLYLKKKIDFDYALGFSSVQDVILEESDDDSANMYLKPLKKYYALNHETFHQLKEQQILQEQFENKNSNKNGLVNLPLFKKKNNRVIDLIKNEEARRYLTPKGQKKFQKRVGFAHSTILNNIQKFEHNFAVESPFKSISSSGSLKRQNSSNRKSKIL